MKLTELLENKSKIHYTYLQGFRVLKEDVQRLRDLHAKLEKGKISPNEIKEVLKKERRRAEKSLAKSIKNVCYQCRRMYT